MAKRARVHSRDLQPQLATPKGLLTAARVQRFDWPMQLPTTPVDELGRKLHVGTTTEIPQVTVTMEAFDVSHDTISMLAGYTPATFPVSGVSVTDLKQVDVIGHIRDSSTKNIVNALYVKRGTVTAMDATFGVRANSTVSYTISSNSKKELKQPVYYQSFTLASGTDVGILTKTPTFLTRTSGYVLSAYRTGTDGTTSYLDEGTDFTVTGTTVQFGGSNVATGDVVWVTYTSANTTTQFAALNDVAPAAIQGKYVPVTISVAGIKRVQSANIRVAFTPEEILEMGGLGKPVGYEVGVPSVTGQITVLKTDNEILSLLEGVTYPTTVENDMEYAKNTLPLKIELKDPRNASKVLLTYYIPSITITQESDTDSVNQSMNEVFDFESSTGELIILSGTGVY